MNAKEHWIDVTMESLDGVGRAALNPSVKEKILEGFQATVTVRDSISIKQVWKIAAVILLLFSLNVFTIVYFGKPSGNRHYQAKSIAREYFSYLGNYNL